MKFDRCRKMNLSEVRMKSIPVVSPLLTCNNGTCGVVFGCLHFCFGKSGVVYWKLSIVQSVPSQHPISAVLTWALGTHTE